MLSRVGAQTRTAEAVEPEPLVTSSRCQPGARSAGICTWTRSRSTPSTRRTSDTGSLTLTSRVRPSSVCTRATTGSPAATWHGTDRRWPDRAATVGGSTSRQGAVSASSSASARAATPSGRTDTPRAASTFTRASSGTVWAEPSCPTYSGCTPWARASRCSSAGASRAIGSSMPSCGSTDGACRRTDTTLEGTPVRGTRRAPVVTTGALLLDERCARGDLNPHVLADTATSTLRVYQFRHSRSSVEPWERLRRPPRSGPVRSVPLRATRER